MSEVPIQLGETYKIRRLLPRHFRILDMVLAGHDNVHIANVLGISTRSITMLKQSPLFQNELVRMRDNPQERIMLDLDRQAIMGKSRSILEDASMNAAETLEGLLDSEDDSIKLRAADSILDRVFGKKGEGNQAGVVINISAEHVQLLNLALKESVDAKSKSADRPAPNGSEVDDEFRLEDGTNVRGKSIHEQTSTGSQCRTDAVQHSFNPKVWDGRNEK